jgi:hypothetical protein
MMKWLEVVILCYAVQELALYDQRQLHQCSLCTTEKVLFSYFAKLIRSD